MLDKVRRVMRVPKILVRKLLLLLKTLKKTAWSAFLYTLKIAINKHSILAVEIIYEEYKLKQQQDLLKKVQSYGHGVRINGEIYVRDPKSLSIGNNVHIGKGCFFVANGGLVIGDNTHISRSVTIYTTNHQYIGSALPYDEMEIPKPVTIGRNVWIGMRTCIIPGVEIGEGAVIGMGTVVSRNVPAGAVVGTAPQRIIKTRKQEHYEQLDRQKKYGGISGRKLEAQQLAKFRCHPSREMENLFFVLSTGRSGTLSIAHILSQHPEIECFHESSNQLIRISTELAHGEKDHREVKAELSAIYFNKSICRSIYGESDQKFWNLVSLLNELFPKCKFIWLTRHGKKVVSSMVSRGWYSSEQQRKGHPTKPGIERWYYYRLNGFASGCFSFDKWNQLSAFEKNCWYWSHVNETIGEELNKIDQTRWIKVRLENLMSELPTITSFLGARPCNFKNEQRHVTTNPVMNPKSWSEKEIQLFNYWCGEQMDIHYPN